MARISSIDVSLGADSRPLQRELKKAQRSTKNFSKQANANFAKLGGSLAALVGVNQLANFARQTFAAAKQLKQFNKITGLSVETLQEYQFAIGELTTLTDKSVNVAIQRFTRRFAEARQGMGEAQGALKELGINLKQSSEGAFNEALIALGKLENSADRTRLAFKLFDTEGVAIAAAAAAGGGKALIRLRDGARDAGQVISGESIDAINELGNSLNTFVDANINRAIRGFGKLSQAILDTFNIGETRELESTIEEYTSRLESARKRLSNLSSGATDANTVSDYLFGTEEKRQKRQQRALNEQIENVQELEKVITDSQARLAALNGGGAELGGVGGEGGEGDDGHQAKLDRKINADAEYSRLFNEMHATSLTEREALDFEAALKQQEIRDTEVLLEQQKDALILKSKQNLNKAIADLESTKLKSTIDFIQQSTAAAAKENKAAFAVNKAASIAQAYINTSEGATKALAQGGVLGPILAGVVIAAGAMNIATIASQQFPGRQFGGPVKSGQPYQTGEYGTPEVFVPEGDGEIVPLGDAAGGGMGGSYIANLTVTNEIGLGRNANATVDAAGKATISAIIQGQRDGRSENLKAR